jgi:hypothetical protein
LIIADDIAAAIARGELDGKRALAELRAFAETREVYAQLGALAIARAIDPAVGEAVGPTWTTWLAARFGDRMSARAKTRSEREVIESLAELLGNEQVPRTAVDGALTLVDRQLRDGKLPYSDVVAAAAAKGGADLFDRIVTTARSAREQRDWLELLGEFPAAFAEPTAALIEKTELPIAGIWSAVERFFERRATRSAAWRAVRPRLDAFAKRMPAADLLEPLGRLCSKPERDEVAAAFATRVPRAALDRTLGMIDRCLRRRAQLGDLAAALAASR